MISAAPLKVTHRTIVARPTGQLRGIDSIPPIVMPPDVACCALYRALQLPAAPC